MKPGRRIPYYNMSLADTPSWRAASVPQRGTLR